MFDDFEIGWERKKKKRKQLDNIPKNTSHRELLFGDFDGDGVKNVDDFKPFNPDVKKFPNPKKNPGFYHKAQFGGFDTKMSDVLRDIEKSNNRHSSFLKQVLKNNSNSYGRIKTVPSTIEKLKRERYHKLKDIAGATILTKDRDEANKKAKQLKKQYRFDPDETDDFYLNPLNDVYYAHHLGLMKQSAQSDEPKRIELQVKSKPMERLHKKMHSDYKKGKPLKKYEKKAKSLFDQGF